MIKKPKILIYDIETTPLRAWIWRLGEQTVRHPQLEPTHNEYKITTIAYKWFGKGKVKCLHGDHIIEEFDKLVKEADVTLGKNSDRFDVKHINTQRMLKNLPPLPQWMETTDDLEKQMRKFFVFPSMSLDYISQIFGTGGKMKMEFQDWVDIENYTMLTDLFKVIDRTKDREAFCNYMFKERYLDVMSKGETALNKMIKYNKKDVLDTEAALKRVLPHIKLKYNSATVNDGFACISCGSKNLVTTKIVIVGKTKYQQFECKDHNGYGGRCTYGYDKSNHKVFGKMG